VIQEVVMFTEACLYYCIVVSHVTLFATLKSFAHETQIDCKYCERVGLQKERCVFVTFFKNRQVFVSSDKILRQLRNNKMLIFSSFHQSIYRCIHIIPLCTL
jgi:hypothetical protein